MTTHVSPALVAPRDSSDTACKYYRVVTWVKLVDHLHSQLKARLEEKQRTALQGLCLIPAVLVTMPSDVAQDRVVSFASDYKEDLDNLSSVQSELGFVENEMGTATEPVRFTEPSCHSQRRNPRDILHVA